MDDIREGSKCYTLEERLCETHFLQTVSRTPQGRYIVKLPIKSELINNLGNSRDIALKRLYGLEKRFSRDPNLKKRYAEFIHEYISLGHMKLVDEKSTDEPGAYYLPHHCVFKEDAKGTKLRVVFDGSCKTDTGLSLNDSMMVGPVVQEDLTSILIRFRTFRYALVADIIKMYRQISLHPSQTRLQRILWRDDVNSEVKTFELTTVTYGTSAASYLSTRCLKDLAEKHEKEFPLGSLRVKRDFYVDDLLTGSDSFSEALTIRDQILQLLKLGSFELSKWGSNCPDLLADVNDQGNAMIQFDKDADFRILGIRWDRDDDTLRFSYNSSQSSSTITKRSVLSQVSRLFDPLGLLGPIIVVAKLLIQDLWQSGIDWDESVPQEIHTKWCLLQSQLHHVNQLQIPRYVKHCSNLDCVQVHGYCDASQRAYGACVYVRTKLGPNDYQSHLLCSRSRVAPLKAISLPRLELSAALLLSQLIDKIKASIDLTNIKIYLWTDSTIVLNWINSASRKWTVFVANRVGEIQRLTALDDWRHVASADNPADPLSRGLFPDDLADSTIWWHGPAYLKLPEDQWPSDEFDSIDTEVPEQRKICTVATSSDSIIIVLINKFSSLSKVCRIIAYCIRFRKSRKDVPPTTGITPKEISESLNVLCRDVQKQAFSGEYESLSKNKSISKSSVLSSLAPFMGDDGLIRVGGRLKNAELPFGACHPIALPRNHVLTRRIIEREHIRNMHAGVQATMAAIRQKFWPLSLKSTTRNVINKCITCFKAKPVFSEALMGNLPRPRVTISRPFSQCGVDYAGPVILREGKRRNARNHKAYIAVFVCFATKAMHLELVSDLTTEAFIAALKRLIARRGKPDHMYSDNGTNFVGAQKQIKEFYNFIKGDHVQAAIETFLCDHQTAWSFIPPHAPHFGGLWEAAVKSCKFHLTRIVGGAPLTFEELQTTLCEIEAILNSRPLIALSSDPNDMGYISPGHFLVGAPLNSLPNPNLHDVNTNMLNRWQIIEQMRQHFWSRWSGEYLNSLQERHKWKTCKGQQLKPGQLVLIKQPRLASLQWTTGRVEEVQVGSDKIARSATVKTARGSYIRPLTKLAILPEQSLP